MSLRKNITALVLINILFVFSSYGQEGLYIPRNIKAAYDKGTRSYDGNPGAEYWQNSSDYKIDVEIDPATYKIMGREKVIYYNNSPDSLRRIVLRLYPNIFKRGSARDYSFNPEGVTEGVTIDEIKIDGLSVNLENGSIFRVQNTIALLNLPKTLSPNSSMNISVEWSFQLSAKSNLRMGIYDSTTIFVGYWYPQVSVYDDVDGWDFNNYDGQVEFYNDFSDFDVNITVPNKFGVWATGELSNPEEVLGKEIMKKYSSAKNSNKVVRIITTEDLSSSPIYKNNSEKNIWKFNASNVTDFAFVISDKYLWDGLQIINDSASNKKVFIQAIYPEDSPDFFDVAEVSRELIDYFSQSIPGIVFPYPTMIAFNNGSLSGGGMEFPMMINNGSQEIWENTVALTAHEISHQYFPFYVGTNEKKYAFMDEGWAVMLPFNYMEEFAGINARLISTVSSYESIAGTENDIPPMAISLYLGYPSYRNSAYNRPSIAYEFLNDMLGDDLFIKALQEFIERWNGKHPTPYDLFFTFNEVTGKDLNWFWKPWFFEFGYPDLAIEKVEIGETTAKISIRKNGTIPTPINLKLIYLNETEDEYYYSSDVWKDGDDIFIAEVDLTGILNEVQLGSLTIPDSDRENNYFLVH